jgi:hypothetical protein
VENPPLAKGDEGGFSDREDMEIFMIDKISPNPSLLKRGIRVYFKVYPQKCLEKQIYRI